MFERNELLSSDLGEGAVDLVAEEVEEWVDDEGSRLRQRVKRCKEEGKGRGQRSRFGRKQALRDSLSRVVLQRREEQGMRRRLTYSMRNTVLHEICLPRSLRKSESPSLTP